MTQFKKDDRCEIVEIHRKDAYHDRKHHFIGKKVRVICATGQMFPEHDGLFNGWVETLEPVPQVKLEKGGFTHFTHAELKKIE